MTIKCDIGKFKPTVIVRGNKRATKEYSLWRGIIERCYSEAYHMKFPTYVGCILSENFRSFQFFAEWCQSQIGFTSHGYQIDKDLLSPSNKIYSEHTCVFVPREINSFVLKHKSRRGEFPIGVFWSSHHNKFKVTVNDGKGKSKYVGVFSDQNNAFIAYKNAKESIAKDSKVFWSGKVDTRVIEVLRSFKVNIDD